MPTPADIKAAAKLLEEGDFQSPEEAARAVLELYDDRTRDRMTYAVAVNGRPLPHIYVGFGNREEGKRWTKQVALDVAGLDVWVVPVWNKDAVLPRHQKMTDEIRKKNEVEPLPERKRATKRQPRATAS